MFVTLGGLIEAALLCLTIGAVAGGAAVYYLCSLETK